MRDWYAPRSRSCQKGVALLHALVIIGVTAGVAVQLSRENIDAYARFEMMSRSDQARQYALAAEWLARQLLRADQEGSNIDHLGESWAAERHVFPLDSSLIDVRIVDLQGLFNLNALTDADGTLNRAVYDGFNRLLDDAGAPRGTAATLARQALDKPLSSPNVKQEERLFGTGRQSTRDLMMGGSELRVLSGITATVYRRLRPLVTALPVPTEINVNTSPAPVLKALAPDIDDRVVKEILRSRSEVPFASAMEFRNRMAGWVSPEVAAALKTAPVTVSSSWFRIEADVRGKAARARLVTIARRSGDGTVDTLMRLEGRP